MQQADRSATRPPRSSRGTTLLYARPGIVVTTEQFTVGRNTFAVADLTHLRVGRGPHDRLAVRAAAVTATLITGVGVLLGFTGGLQRLTAGAYLTLGVVFLLPVLLALAATAGGRRRTSCGGTAAASRCCCSAATTSGSSTRSAGR
nr:DUF6232 family protein [Micromonospora sp. 4G55]